MGQGSQKSGHLSERVRAHLRARHPVKTAEAVEAATRGRVSASAFAKGAQRGGGFSGEALAILIAAYGPDLLAAALPGLSWISDAARAERQRALEAECARLAVEIARLGEAARGSR